ncbi:MAG TPA: nucleotide disphospho-sugar-binding domain-containing protein [Puia sp.]|jgi:MGT family glycosyltransferase|nr:nucleotide disphospho-sugar-binding domain-containing protein [Puia sp.]
MNATAITRKKILFANFPADGHFNPLTGLAIHLEKIGYEVRWYTSKIFTEKLKKLQIHHYPFKKALDPEDGDFDKALPGRTEKKSQIAKLKFDIIHAFILRGPEYFEDIQEIYQEYPFDLLVADCAFTGISFVTELMKIPVVSIGVFPLSEKSRDLPPNGLGLTPSGSFAGKIRQRLLHRLCEGLIFRGPDKVLHRQYDTYGIPHNREGVFDMLIRKSDLLLQSGSPGFEYYRSDLGENIRFIGPLFPYTKPERSTPWFDPRVRQYKKILLVTQGTVEKDTNKIIVPTLEAFRDSNTLVIATTGGNGTEKLRKLYPQSNFIIEDFIPFADVMPYANAYITNGGYGGVMLGIKHQLPLVVAGKHEGKNEICARVGYFNLGINLRTEKPLPRQICAAVNKVMTDPLYRHQVKGLAREFSKFKPEELCARHIGKLLEWHAFHSPVHPQHSPIQTQPAFAEE